MALQDYAKNHGAGQRDPGLVIKCGDSADILLDCSADPKTVALHPEVKRGATCKGDGCALCAAGLRRTVKHVLSAYRKVDGAWCPVSVWLTNIELRKLVDAVGNSSASWVTLRVDGKPVIGDNGQPKVSAKGTPWCDLAWTRIAAAGPQLTADGVIVCELAAPSSQTH